MGGSPRVITTSYRTAHCLSLIVSFPTVSDQTAEIIAVSVTFCDMGGFSFCSGRAEPADLPLL